jgi:hypothetical protein
MTNVFAVNIQATRINKACGTQVDRIAMGDVGRPLLVNPTSPGSGLTDGLCGRNEANYTSSLPMTSFRQIAAKQRNVQRAPARLRKKANSAPAATRSAAGLQRRQ